MLRAVRATKFAVCIAGLTALSGCSGAAYPTLPSLGGLTGGTLSPDEQKKAINDLSTEEKVHGTRAAEEIERR